uniref:Uncharacterized protein n=1 Tax=Romanomermis culicivorax TaxID=13658 RepID=A0A915JML7_ROMCU
MAKRPASVQTLRRSAPLKPSDNFTTASGYLEKKKIDFCAKKVRKMAQLLSEKTIGNVFMARSFEKMDVCDYILFKNGHCPSEVDIFQYFAKGFPFSKNIVAFCIACRQEADELFEPFMAFLR